MNRFIDIAQIVVAILLITAILLQAKGTGLSGVFGGEGNVYRTKRGFEKILFYSTVALSVLFFGIAMLNMYFTI